MTAGGASALYSYSSLNNPRMAAIKVGLGLAYLYAGRQLVTGNPTLGYDLGSITSLALVSQRQGACKLRVMVAGTCRRTQRFAYRNFPAGFGQAHQALSAAGSVSAVLLPPGTCSAEVCPVSHACVVHAQVGVAGPRARATQEMSSVAMAALGGISSVSNIIKSYEVSWWGCWCGALDCSFCPLHPLLCGAGDNVVVRALLLSCHRTLLGSSGP